MFERNLVLNDPDRPAYTGTTSVSTYSRTRYLLRKIKYAQGRGNTSEAGASNN